MGRAPVPDTIENDESVGKMAMLDALRNVAIALEDGSMMADEFYFKIATSKFNKQSGRGNRSSRRSASYEAALVSQILIEVESVFQDVEDGFLEEEGYHFELATSHFTYTSGEYPPQENDGCTLWDDEQESVPYSLRKITGHLNGSCFRTTFIVTLVVCALVVHTGASPIAETEQPLTLTAGIDGTVSFECSNEHQSDLPKYYTVTFEGKDRPFYLDGALDPEGLMSPDQLERFNVVYDENNSVMTIEITITSVTVEDQGTYIVMVIIPGDSLKPRWMKQVVIIYIPPSPASCFLIPSESKIRPYEVHCHSKPGNGDATLACFQNGFKIPYKGDGPQIVYKRVFWLSDTIDPISCCAHDIKEITTITESLCNQYKYPPTNVINNPEPTENVPTEMALATGPSSNDEKTKLPSVLTSVHSGCAQNLIIWQNAMIPLMAIVAYGCIHNHSLI